MSPSFHSESSCSISVGLNQPDCNLSQQYPICWFHWDQATQNSSHCAHVEQKNIHHSHQTFQLKYSFLQQVKRLQNWVKKETNKQPKTTQAGKEALLITQWKWHFQLRFAMKQIRYWERERFCPGTPTKRTVSPHGNHCGGSNAWMNRKNNSFACLNLSRLHQRKRKKGK